ncbi:MAG: leucine-rich repeat protein [Anaerostipes sp.]|nr:leucine-rich repeat protein [Anaerostipes sp.]
MRFCYREEGDEITILRCYGKEAFIEIPKKIKGKSVTKLAPYTFSDRKRKEEDGSFYDTGFDNGELPILCGRDVSEVIIPETVVELGNYLFYGCANLRRIYVTQNILRTGRGVFTGCKPQKIDMEYFHGTKSCLKDIIGDIRFCLDVKLWIDGQEIRLIFPEYYEEAVENTPARIVENYFNGSGYKYRQCVFQKGIDLENYDELFPEAISLEKEITVVRLAMNRLLYPYKLETQAKEQYVSYLKEHMEKLLDILLKREKIEEFQTLSKMDVWNEESINKAIEITAKTEKRELLSFLMNEKRERFGQKKKTFEL